MLFLSVFPAGDASKPIIIEDMKYYTVRNHKINNHICIQIQIITVQLNCQINRTPDLKTAINTYMIHHGSDIDNNLIRKKRGVV